MAVPAPSALQMCRAAGLRRIPDGTGHSWVGDGDVAISDEGTLARLRALAIPPAWREVWASTDPSARIQATGIDTRGRTQYRYSLEAEEDAARHKFYDLLLFATALPRLRARVDWDLAFLARHTPMSRVKRATAAVVRLIDCGLFRVGTERYARENHTYGLRRCIVST